MGDFSSSNFYKSEFRRRVYLEYRYAGNEVARCVMEGRKS